MQRCASRILLATQTKRDWRSVFPSAITLAAQMCFQRLVSKRRAVAKSRPQNSAADGEQLSKAPIAQPDSEPGDHARRERDEYWIRLPDAGIGGDGSAQITGEQYRAQDRGARNEEQDDAAQLQACEERQSVRRPADSCKLRDISGVSGQLPRRAHPHNESGPERNSPASPQQPMLSLRFTYRNIHSSVHVFLPFGALQRGPPGQCGAYRIPDRAHRPETATRLVKPVEYTLKSSRAAPAVLDKFNFRRVQDPSCPRKGLPLFALGLQVFVDPLSPVRTRHVREAAMLAIRAKHEGCGPESEIIVRRLNADRTYDGHCSIRGGVGSGFFVERVNTEVCPLNPATAPGETPRRTEPRFRG